MPLHLPARRAAALLFATAAASAALAVPAGAAPVNDDFADALSLGTGTSSAVAFDLTGATREVGEPLHTWRPDAGTNGTGKAVWFKWTPSATGGTRATACALLDSNPAALNMDYSVHVYTGGSVGSLTKVADWATYTQCLARTAAFTAVKNTTYYIAVDSNAYTLANTSAAYTFKLQQDTAAPTASFVDPPAVTGTKPAFKLAQADAHPANRYRCQVDQQPLQDCWSQTPLPAISGGPHTLRVWGIDDYNNQQASPTQLTWTVDAQGPTITVTPPADPAWKTWASVPLTVTASEPVSGMSCLMHQNKTFYPCWQQGKTTGAFATTLGSPVVSASYGWSSMVATDVYGNVGPQASFVWQREAIPAPPKPGGGGTGTGTTPTPTPTPVKPAATGTSPAPKAGTAPTSTSTSTSTAARCAASVAVPSRVRLTTLRRTGLAVQMRPTSAACRASIKLTGAGRTLSSRNALHLPGRRRTTVRLRPTSATAAKRLRVGQRVNVTLTLGSATKTYRVRVIA